MKKANNIEEQESIDQIYEKYFIEETKCEGAY